VPQTSGPQSATPSRISSQRPSNGVPAETMPQPKAHIGANQVIGFNSSRTAAALGRSGVATKEAGNIIEIPDTRWPGVQGMIELTKMIVN
jgi:hypothetical protein